MAKTIQIRGVPEELHAELRSRAAALGVSLSEYLLGEVERVAARPVVADTLRRAGGREWGIPRGAAAEAVRALRGRN